MSEQFYIQLKVFLQLLRRDLTLSFKNIDNYINTAFWTILSLLVYHFILPQLGLSYNGTFFLVGCIVAKSFYGIMDNSSQIIADLAETKTISYDMTLPLSHTLLFLKIALANAIYIFSIACTILPLGKILLWNHLYFPNFQTGKYLLMLLTISLFCGAFSLIIIGKTKSVNAIEDVYSGTLFPLLYLGCFQFTWKSMFESSPFFAYINCINPVMYMFEGIRSATLDPSLSLSFWLCFIILNIYTLIVGYIGISLLKNRLDAI